jgi:hypothetical protein
MEKVAYRAGFAMDGREDFKVIHYQ